MSVQHLPELKHFVYNNDNDNNNTTTNNNNNNNNSNNNKEKEKTDKYRDLTRELRKLWKVKTRVVPTVIGALGTIPKGLVGHLEGIGMNLDLAKIQKTTLLGTARILRRVLD